MSTMYLRATVTLTVYRVLLFGYGVHGRVVVREEPIHVQNIILLALDEIDQIWLNVTNVEWLYNTQQATGSDTELLKSFKKVGDKIEQFKLGRVPEEAVSSIWSYAKINVETYGIEGLYNAFRKFQLQSVQKHKGYNRALMDLAESVLLHSDTAASVPSSLEQMHTHIVNNEDSRHRSLFRLVLEEAEGNLCHVEQSAQQILYNLYNRLQVIQLKGYTMMQFSWMLLRLYKKGNFTLESQLMQNKYIERMSEQVRSIKETLILADTSYWRCDPKHQVEGETYTQITRLVQGYIQNEVDLNPKESCMENCGYYSVTKQHGCFGGQFCGKQRGCAGEIFDCQYIDSDMWVCQSDMRKTNRRYDWVEYENGRILGNKGSCARQSKVDSWWRWLFWHCSYCFCMCDDPTNSDRYFNLRIVASDTDNNKVVTGLRFIKQNRIIHLQIQEGTLLPYGNINQSSITWRPIDQYTTKSSDVRDGEDYFTLSYYQRAFDLDDLKLTTDRIVTGVRFRKVGSHLNLEVRGTRFNFTSGKLVLPGRGDEWISNDNTDGAPVSPRKQLVLESPDNPLHSLAPSQIYSNANQYLLFTHSDIDLDAAQTTVPFIDTQIVAPQPAVPLSGIGVHYKGRRWFGGYIAPKVFTYDYSNHLKEQIMDMKNNDNLNTIN